MLELIVSKPLKIELRDGPALKKPQADEVKINVHLGGICGSDIALFQGKFSHATYPVRAGHELIGTIVEKGEDVPYALGTRVVIIPNTYCGKCEYCKQGKTNICDYKQSYGINKDGGFAEQLIIPAKYVMPIPQSIDDEIAVLIEPFAVALSAIKKVKISPKMNVAVVGIGNIGLMVAILADYLGANVTAVEPNLKKHKLMNQVSGISTILPEDATESSFDIVIEAAGTTNSVKKAISLMKKGGSLVMIGMVEEVPLPIMELVRNEQTIHGSIIYKYPEDFTETINYLNKLQPTIRKMISKIVPIENYLQAYEDAQSGDYTKIILDFSKK